MRGGKFSDIFYHHAEGKYNEETKNIIEENYDAIQTNIDEIVSAARITARKNMLIYEDMDRVSERLSKIAIGLGNIVNLIKINEQISKIQSEEISNLLYNESMIKSLEFFVKQYNSRTFRDENVSKKKDKMMKLIGKYYTNMSMFQQDKFGSEEFYHFKWSDPALHTTSDPS